MDIKAAHKFSSVHRAQVEASPLCGCFYCLQTYPPTEISEWVDDEQTALCPKCGIDSVIGSNSAVPLDHEFLSQMHKLWF